MCSSFTFDIGHRVRQHAFGNFQRVPTSGQVTKVVNKIRPRKYAGTRSVTANSQTDSKQLLQIKDFTGTSVFRNYIQGAVFVVVLAGVDAAYSGDWSRIGVISKDFEDGLKPLVVALGFFHIGCAVVAGRIAASKQLSVTPAVLKVLAVGFLALVEVYFKDPKEA